MLGRSIVALAAIAVATSAHAQSIKPEEAVKMRQGLMTAIKWQFAPMGAVVKGEAEFGQDMVARAVNLAALSKVAPQGFPADSDMVPNTKAKADIWEKPERFQAAMATLQAETAKLAEIARSGDEGSFKKQFLAVNQACKDCHETFRSE